MHPVTGFHVDSVHSIDDCAMLRPPIPVFLEDLGDDLTAGFVLTREEEVVHDRVLRIPHRHRLRHELKTGNFQKSFPESLGDCRVLCLLNRVDEQASLAARPICGGAAATRPRCLRQDSE